MNKMKRKMMKVMCAMLAPLFLLPMDMMAFCGFYVAKADVDIFNEASQVIIAKDGNQYTVTMSNDYKGPLDEFAMVVPVPTVLERDDIKIAEQYIFDKLDAYSGPRLAEYYDQNPCYEPQILYMMEAEDAGPPRSAMKMKSKSADISRGVKIEAQYTVGEYDILILSAKESTGLKNWLLHNGYKIPAKAEEVLQPYIKSKLKFFVVKVNLDKIDGETQNLRPLQISYESNRYMLPIRLGMANSNGYQDMIVYHLTKKGRVEATNYRTVKIPTDFNVPEFIDEEFGDFYGKVFDTRWNKSPNAVFLEYAWDLSSSNFVRCDPCATTPPAYAELIDAGVRWIGKQRNRGGADYSGDVFITRQHVRYSRSDFPQDLMFQETPNKRNFQGRYVINRSVEKANCEEAIGYFDMVLDRRNDELENLERYANWDISDKTSEVYVAEIEAKLEKLKPKFGMKNFRIIENEHPEKTTAEWASTNSGNNGGKGLLMLSIFFIIGLIPVSTLMNRRNKRSLRQRA